MARSDGRAPDQLRPVRITPNFLDHAEGSALIEVGKTRVLCAASVEDAQPPHLQHTEQGWITAEYAMLPGSTSPRKSRNCEGSTTSACARRSAIGESPSYMKLAM
jgi:ribonuclease PH